MNKRPSFLKKLHVKQGDFLKGDQILVNWAVLNKFMQSAEKDKLTSNDWGKMILIELHRGPGPRSDGPRWHILERLIGRFNKVRRDEEWNEVLDLVEKG